MPTSKPFGYRNDPSTCRWCGEPLKPFKYADLEWAKESDLRLGGMGDNLFCRKECGYDFGIASARDGYADWKSILDLLAAIHHDGGEYAAKHGIEKAAKAASELWFLRAEHYSFASVAAKERYESAECALRECCLLALRTLDRVTFGLFDNCEEEKAVFRNTISRLNEHEKLFKAVLTEEHREP